MNILNEILGAGNGQVLRQIAGQFGLDESDARNAINNLLPALSQGVKRNAQQQGGMDSLLSALERGNHGRYIDDPQALAEETATIDGNNILGHILGNKQNSREVASKAAESTGMDMGMLKQMLPVLAGIVMGTLNKQAPAARAQGGNEGSSTDDLLGSLGSFLDMDNDGSIADDVLDFAKKMF